jgi:hypothetical protein
MAHDFGKADAGLVQAGAMPCTTATLVQGRLKISPGTKRPPIQSVAYLVTVARRSLRVLEFVLESLPFCLPFAVLFDFAKLESPPS